MIPVLPVLLKDGYKAGHKHQYPQATKLVYSNLTPRSSRVDNVSEVMGFGFQYFVLEYLKRQFDGFFQSPKDVVVNNYRRRLNNYLGPNQKVDHIADLHDLQHLPLQVKAVPEGTLVPLRTPLLTIRNTRSEFFWLTNMVETLLSNVLWMPITSATTAFQYRKRFEKFARITGADPLFIPWQGHDFSMRGLSGVEAACLSGAAHLLSFTGTDTIPAIDFLETYYGANSDKELVGGSVPATEHSVMCIDGSDGEEQTIRRLITEVYPTGIVSIVCDTWDFWKVLTETLPKLKNEIMSRDGKVVIRPDSGDPVNVICGDPFATFLPEQKGAIEVLWDVFGGSATEKGYRVLDPHIGLIYGDSITPQRQEQILTNLAFKGFASSNVVLGIGSYTYQYVTRDTYGLAMKATYAEVGFESRPIFKAPKTDNGMKNSAKGLLKVNLDGSLVEDVSWAEEGEGLLQTIFKNGELHNLQTLKQIRARVESQL